MGRGNVKKMTYVRVKQVYKGMIELELRMGLLLKSEYK